MYLLEHHSRGGTPGLLTWRTPDTYSHSTTSRRPRTSRIFNRFPGFSGVSGLRSSEVPKRLGSTCVGLRSVGCVAVPKRMWSLMITI
jgi:hypothetical protein